MRFLPTPKSLVASATCSCGEAGAAGDDAGALAHAASMSVKTEARTASVVFRILKKHNNIRR
jgi:hypothetical protein